MTMAFVTRCPYCGALWRLPDKETAENGPVRCSACRHSFDATSQFAEVPEERFPAMPPAPASGHAAQEPAPQADRQATEPPAVPADAAATATAAAAPVPAPEHGPAPKEPAAGPASPVETPAAAEAAPAGEQRKEPAEDPGEKAEETAGEKTREPAAENTAAADERLLRLHTMTPGEELATSRPDASLAKIIPAKSKPDAAARPIRVAETLANPPRPASQRSGAFASVFTAFVLLMILAAALAVIFNQKVMNLIPASAPVYNAVCGKVPCPGFYLSDISAFVVTKSNLRALDESGNYVLEITLVNGSDMPQAVPALDIELVDDADTTLMHKTLLASEYLTSPVPESLGADRSITVRFSMQTNVTPARCIVKPVYLN